MSLNVYRDWLGIPENELPADHYRLFGLARFTTDEGEIEKATLKTIGEIRKRQLDPDHRKEVQDLLTELARARSLLKDQFKRYRYDRELMSASGRQSMPCDDQTSKTPPIIPFNDIKDVSAQNPTQSEPHCSNTVTAAKPSDTIEPFSSPAEPIINHDLGDVTKPRLAVPPTHQMPAIRPGPRSMRIYAAAFGLAALLLFSVVILARGRNPQPGITLESLESPRSKETINYSLPVKRIQEMPMPGSTDGDTSLKNPENEAPQPSKPDGENLPDRERNPDGTGSVPPSETGQETPGHDDNRAAEPPAEMTPPPEPATPTEVNPAYVWPAESNSGIPGPTRLPDGMIKGNAPGEYLWEKDRSIMVFVPAGKYLVGLNEYRNSRQADLDGFFIDKYEVTASRFKSFLAAMKETTDTFRYKHPLAAVEIADLYGKPEECAGDLPAVNVTWFGAWAYARYQKKALPLADEWEIAASTDPVLKVRGNWPWGRKSEPGCANTSEYWKLVKGKAGQPMPVGSFLKDRSPCGCMDMGGNVREWCLYDVLPPITQYLPSERDAQGNTVYLRFADQIRYMAAPVRGGAYSIPFYFGQSQIESLDPASFYGPEIGFRCVVRLNPGINIGRLALEAKTAGRPQEALNLISEMKLESERSAEMAKEMELLCCVLSGIAEREEREGKLEEAITSFELASVAAPDDSISKVIADKLGLLKDCCAILLIAELAAKNESSPRMKEALDKLEVIISANPEAAFCKEVRKRISLIDKSFLSRQKIIDRPPLLPQTETTKSEIVKILSMLKSKKGDDWFQGIEALNKIDNCSIDGMRVLAQAINRTKEYGDSSRKGICTAIGKAAAAGGENLAIGLKALETALEDPENVVRDSSIRAIGGLGHRSKDLARSLLPLLKKHDYAHFDLIVRSLGEIGPMARSSIAQLAPYVKSASPQGDISQKDRISEILTAIRRMMPRHESGEVTTLIIALMKRDPYYEMIVLETLSRIANPTDEVLSLFLKAIPRQSSDEQLRVLYFLENFGPACAPINSELLKLVFDESLHDRCFPQITIVIACTGLEARESARVFLSHLAMGTASLHETAMIIGALGRGGREFKPEFIKAWDKYYKLSQYKPSTSIIDYLDACVGDKPFLEWFVQRHPEIKTQQMIRYICVAGPAARDAISFALDWLENSRKADERQLAAKALGRIGQKDGLVEDSLRKALLDPDVNVREEAFRALETLGLWMD